MQLSEIEVLPQTVPLDRVRQLCADLLGSPEALEDVVSLRLGLDSVEVEVRAHNSHGRLYATEDNEVARHRIRIPVER